MHLIQLLDRPIAYHRVLVPVCGSVNAALFLSQVIYWTNRTDESGWFYKTSHEWQDETGMSRRELDTARKQLKERKLISEELKGNPPKMWFKLEKETLQTLLEYGGKRQINMAEPAKSIRRKAPNPTIKAESTTESKSASAYRLMVEKVIAEKLNENRLEVAEDLVTFAFDRRDRHSPMTQRAVALLCKKANEAPTKDSVTKAVEEAIEKGYRSIFPKDENAPRRKPRNPQLEEDE